MSEDRRKNLRTQGKYSDGKVQKSRDKKQRNSYGSKDSPEARLPKRKSDGNKSVDDSPESESSLKYTESSDYTFQQLEEVVKPTEIKGRGEVILSKTDKGESRILFEPRFLHEIEADNYYDKLKKEVNFDSRNIVINGKEYPQPRLVAWFGPYPYSYSGTTLDAAEMPEIVLEIKEKVEAFLKSQEIEATFNSVLINLYRDGKDSVAWHSDDELTLGICPIIASVSLGETRKFEMRPKMESYNDKNPSDGACKYVVHLTHGSLVIMTGSMQDDWQHRVPKEYHDRHPRINLTFRTVFPFEKAPDYVPVKEMNLGTSKMSPNNPSASLKYGYKFDDEHFPSLQKDVTSANSNVTCDTDDNTDEKNWNSELSDDNEHNIESGVTNKNTYPVFNKRGEGFKPKNNVRNNYNYEKAPEKWHNNEPNCDNEKNSLDDKTSKKLWCDDYDPSVNDFPENDTVEEKSGIKCNKSVNNSGNEIEGNKFYEKMDLRKLHNKEASLTVKNSPQNVLSQEECSLKSLNIKTDSYINASQENNMDNEEPSNTYNDVKSNSWVDSCGESNLDIKRATKVALNVDAKAYTNSYVNLVEESDLGHKMLPNMCHYVESSSWVSSSEENNSWISSSEESNLGNKMPPNMCHYVESSSWVSSSEENNSGVKQSAKMMLNVDAKEFIPYNMKSNEANLYSNFELEDLINYDINTMQGKNLQDHAQSLKMKILRRFDEIHRFDKKDVEFLLEITDGSQTDKNQKLITQQICKVVQSNLARNRQPVFVMSSYDRSSKQRGYDNQNYYSDKGKRYSTQNRNSKPNRGRY